MKINFPPWGVRKVWNEVWIPLLSSQQIQLCAHRMLSSHTNVSYASPAFLMHPRCHISFQLVLTVGLLAVVVYLYTVVAFNFFRKFYNKSEDGDTPDMKCDDMLTVSSYTWSHMNEKFLLLLQSERLCSHSSATWKRKQHAW